MSSAIRNNSSSAPCRQTTYLNLNTAAEYTEESTAIELDNKRIFAKEPRNIVRQNCFDKQQYCDSGYVSNGRIIEPVSRRIDKLSIGLGNSPIFIEQYDPIGGIATRWAMPSIHKFNAPRYK